MGGVCAARVAVITGGSKGIGHAIVSPMRVKTPTLRPMRAAKMFEDVRGCARR